MSIAHRTLQDFIAEQVRERIRNGKLPAGAKIDQKALAAEFSVSRMPIREALRQLDAEGYVTLLPHRGAVVTKLSAAEIEETYEIRAVLEGLAARLALPNLDSSALAHIRELLDAMASTEDVHEWVALNGEFHDQIERHGDRRLLLELIHRLRGQCEPYVRMYVHLLHRSKQAQREHEAIFAACESGSPDTLEAAVRNHLRATGLGLANFIGHEAR